MIAFKFDPTKINLSLDRLTEAAEAGARAAAQAGAQVFYEEVKARAPVGTQAEHYFYGREAKKAAKGSKRSQAFLMTRGNLKDSVYQYYNKRLSKGRNKAVYSISWNHREAPYGAMVERGTSRAQAHPFLRPAYDAVRSKALRAVRIRMVEEIKKARE